MTSIVLRFDELASSLFRIGLVASGAPRYPPGRRAPGGLFGALVYRRAVRSTSGRTRR